MSKGPELKSIQGGKVLSIYTRRDFAGEIAKKFEIMAAELFSVFDEAVSQVNPITGDFYLDRNLSEHIKGVIQTGCETLIASLEAEIKEYATDD
jgi:hypothetical protein